jgi:hypothetical protein
MTSKYLEFLLWVGALLVLLSDLVEQRIAQVPAGCRSAPLVLLLLLVLLGVVGVLRRN